MACHRPLHRHKGGAAASLEGVSAAAVGGGSGDGASGAGRGVELDGEAVPDAQTVESALLRQHGRHFLSTALHGAVGMCPDAERESREAAVEGHSVKPSAPFTEIPALSKGT